MMRRASALLLLCLPLAAGCTYHRTLYSPLRPEETPTGEVMQRFTIIRARSIPLFYDHEWDLNLAIPAADVREGMEIRFPGSRAHAVFSEWHHPDRVMAVPTGTIRFVQVRPDAVQAQVDMTANVPSRWSLRRLVWFRYSPQAATEMPWVRPDSLPGAGGI